MQALSREVLTRENYFERVIRRQRQEAFLGMCASLRTQIAQEEAAACGA